MIYLTARLLHHSHTTSPTQLINMGEPYMYVSRWLRDTLHGAVKQTSIIWYNPLVYVMSGVLKQVHVHSCTGLKTEAP